MGDAQAAWHLSVRAGGRATVAQGGYQKWDVETRHTDLVGEMVQHHAAVYPHSSAAPRAGAAQTGAVSQHPSPACLRGGICN